MGKRAGDGDLGVTVSEEIVEMMVSLNSLN